MFLFGELIKSPFIDLLASYSSANHLTLHPSIPLASYFYALHLFGELFSCRPFNSPSFGEFFFCADHITLHPSIVLESYFRADHSIVLSVYPFGELFLCRPSLGESYFRADHLILHPLARYFNVYHITLHPSIPLASYFCAIHPLGKLFSCRPFNSPVFGELFSCRPYNSPPIHPFGELFRADHIITLHPSILLVSYFCVVHPLGELFSCLPFNSPSFGELFFVPII